MCKHREEEADPSTWTQHIDSFILICHPVNPPRTGDWSCRILKVPSTQTVLGFHQYPTHSDHGYIGKEQRGYLRPDPANLNQESDFKLLDLFSLCQKDQEVTGKQGLSLEKGNMKNQWAGAEATPAVRSKMSLLGVSKRDRQPRTNNI